MVQDREDKEYRIHGSVQRIQNTEYMVQDREDTEYRIHGSGQRGYRIQDKVY